VKIWYQSTLNFSNFPNYEKALNAHSKRIASVGTTVIVKGRDTSLGSQLDAMDIIGSPIVYHSVVSRYFVNALLTAEKNGAQAFIVASFSEPILNELRSLANVPVVSMPEACFIAAAMSAPKIGLVTLNKLVVPFIEKSISLHKWKERVSGIHVLQGYVTELELDAGFSSPSAHLKQLEVGLRAAIASGAQAIIPAEGVLGVMAAQNGITEIDGVPIIDAIGSPILVAELAIALKSKTGLAQSRVAYPPPSEAARKVLCGDLVAHEVPPEVKGQAG
jgi:Asp/Glu/hydantoin racemase